MKIRETPKFYVVRWQQYEQVDASGDGRMGPADAYYHKDDFRSCARAHGWGDTPATATVQQHGDDWQLMELLASELTPRRVVFF